MDDVKTAKISLRELTILKLLKVNSGGLSESENKLFFTYDMVVEMLETLFELIVCYNSERTKGFVDFEFYKLIKAYGESLPKESELDFQLPFLDGLK
tara:strand:+ start:2108 stop:2398 length:291 start_codon:yes stop_codon:yes gene_type:complete